MTPLEANRQTESRIDSEVYRAVDDRPAGARPEKECRSFSERPEEARPDGIHECDERVLVGFQLQHDDEIQRGSAGQAKRPAWMLRECVVPCSDFAANEWRDDRIAHAARGAAENAGVHFAVAHPETELRASVATVDVEHLDADQAARHVERVRAWFARRRGLRRLQRLRRRWRRARHFDHSRRIGERDSSRENNNNDHDSPSPTALHETAPNWSDHGSLGVPPRIVNAKCARHPSCALLIVGIAAVTAQSSAFAQETQPYQSVVTATRVPTPVEQVPATVIVLDRTQIDASPDKSTDEVLRNTPSFGAFRRTNSAAADPTSQGLNLRGVGPSGVSRGLVLVDGVPETDAFGGWLYWRALPPLSIDRIEIVPGAGSSLYGNYALGGIVQVFTRAPERRTFDGDAEIGTENTAYFAARGSERWRRVGFAVDADYYRSDGYQTIAPYARGPVDHSTDSDHANANARVEVHPSSRLVLRANGGYFRERQDGGTAFSTATVQLARYSLGATWSPSRIGLFEATFYGHAEEFDQQRPRVDAMRTIATLAGTQTVPSYDVGDALVWTSRTMRVRTLGNVVTVGQDLRWIDAQPREVLSPPSMPKPTSTIGRSVTGQQIGSGFFAQDALAIDKWVHVALAARADYWSNQPAARTTTHIDGTQTIDRLATRGGWELTPRLGIVAAPTPWLRLRAAAYRAFRAPTMNELYRPFQVGTIVTAPNDRLTPETLWGGEVGVDISAHDFFVRATGFANQLFDPITNVTLAQPLADGSQRQRQNLGAARIVGIETSARWRPARRWRTEVSYAFIDATVISAPGQPDLVGKQLVQDPAHRFVASLSFIERRWLEATAELRYTSRQFDDDRNQLPLGGFAVVNLRVSKSLTPNFDVFLAAENLLNQQYLVGRSGVDTVGEPLFVYGGFRYRANRASE